MAHLCHVTPEQLPDMRVIDFALLLKGIDAHIAAVQQAGG